MIELIKKTRTFRRFEQSRAIDPATLKDLVELARLGGSARNSQPWQYALVTDPGDCARVYPFLGWAGYLTDWKGPAAGEQPAAYILCILNRNWLKGNDKEAQFDLGIATQNLLLGAMEQGIGGCRIGAFNPKLAGEFKLAPHQELSLVVALGYPAETVVLETGRDDQDIKYWRDASSIHHVPKRSLDKVLIDIPFV